MTATCKAPLSAPLRHLTVQLNSIFKWSIMGGRRASTHFVQVWLSEIVQSSCF